MAARRKAARPGADARKALAQIEKASKHLQLSLKRIKEKFGQFHYFGPGFPPAKRKGKS